MSIFPDGIKLAPSILAADMGHLADQVSRWSRPEPTGFTSTSWTGTSCPISRLGPWSCAGSSR